jgi:predicted NAD/FAD-dependent oxidoreductase
MAIETDALHKRQWQLRTRGSDDSSGVHGGFDHVLLAIPHPQAAALLRTRMCL